ncbi:Fe2+ transport system protein FeoA [Caldanaerobius fijiensis DSM 17918]|uniref:Fe2+ transport system protein FeoA n=1 Tax=Caldanaerobius fijiensis DSM 17918 TaxID=1121256 RepID=A0A1M5CI95_9THEO|nr:FeoA family protein [Caldanaerobius fijiensis]SHF54391.1 Fe2+ transport system protein FeoA [Caldanaerobius fijiensis DSM 17918]
MTLDLASIGNKLIIDKIDDEKVKIQILRFGISEGSLVKCVDKLPKGPVIIQNRMQEIAIGRKLAEKIKIREVKEG